MNAQLKAALGIALEMAKVMVPAIGEVEEAIKGLKRGEDRRAAVVKIAQEAPGVVEALSPYDIVDNDLYREGVEQLNDGLFKIQKSIHPKKADQ